MDSPPDLSLSPPTPSAAVHPTSPATPTAAKFFNPRRPANPLLLNPKKKRTKLLCFHPGDEPSSSAASTKPKPAARKPDPSAPKITMPCSECGRKFWSWKALYGHMRCHPDRQWRGIHPPPNLHRLLQPSLPEILAITPEDQEAASCLLLLANSGRPQSRELVVYVAPESDQAAAEVESSSAAEAGHRCGICWKVFSTGQALGGHKRCHWDKNASGGGVGGKEEAPAAMGLGGLDLNLPAQAPVEQRGGDLQLVLRLGI